MKNNIGGFSTITESALYSKVTVTLNRSKVANFDIRPFERNRVVTRIILPLLRFNRSGENCDLH